MKTEKTKNVPDDPGPAQTKSRLVLVNDGTLVVGVPGKQGYCYDSDHKQSYDEKRLADQLS